MTPEPALISNDDGLWVVNKPSGWAVHRTNDPAIPDVLTWALDAADAPESLAPVHRIDRGTSGVFLLSPDKSLRAELGRHFTAGAVQKRYLALVYGCLRGRGKLNRPLPDARRGRPLEAETRWEVIEAFRLLSLLRLEPRSGRKHQIRRHLAAAGNAIVGDRRYGPRPPKRVPAFPGRLWLHAQRLELPDGRVFEASLPTPLVEHLEVLRTIDAQGASA